MNGDDNDVPLSDISAGGLLPKQLYSQEQINKIVAGLRVQVALSLGDQVRSGAITDCEALARFADSVSLATKENFIAAFAALTPGPEASKLISLAGGALGIQSTGAFIRLQPPNALSTGFNDSYRDSLDPYSDQAHHFAAFFQLGGTFSNVGLNVAAASTAAAVSAFFVESENGFRNTGDINLGTFAAQLGYAVEAGTVPTSAVGRIIRDKLCAK